MTTRRATASVSSSCASVAIARVRSLALGNVSRTFVSACGVGADATDRRRPTARPAMAEPITQRRRRFSAPRMKCRLTNRDPAPTPSHSSASSASADSAVTGTAVAAEEPVDVQASSSGAGHTTMSSPTCSTSVGAPWPFVDTSVWAGTIVLRAGSPPVEPLSCWTARSSALKRRLTTPTPAPRR